MLKENLVHFTKYNVWANTRILEFIRQISEEKIEVIQNSSFPTIGKTLYHIWGAETIWLKRLLDQSPHAWPINNFKGTFTEACSLFINNSKDIVIYIEGKTEQEIEDTVIYKTLDGKEFYNSVSQIIMHCINHSTYHRGQIVTMLRNVGFAKLASTDYITYCRS